MSDIYFHPTLYNWYNDLSILRLKLNYVNKRGPCCLYSLRSHWPLSYADYTRTSQRYQWHYLQWLCSSYFGIFVRWKIVRFYKDRNTVTVPRPVILLRCPIHTWELKVTNIYAHAIDIRELLQEIQDSFIHVVATFDAMIPSLSLRHHNSRDMQEFLDYLSLRAPWYPCRCLTATYTMHCRM